MLFLPPSRQNRDCSKREKDMNENDLLDHTTFLANVEYGFDDSEDYNDGVGDDEGLLDDFDDDFYDADFDKDIDGGDESGESFEFDEDDDLDEEFY
jgi:hypothetical protein